MKHVLRVLGVAAALAVPTILSAQKADKPISIGVSGGLSLPMGDLGDAADPGFAVAGHVYFKPSALKSIRLRADVSFDRWGLKGADDFGDTDVDASSRSLGFLLNAIYDVKSSGGVQPYLIGGVGFFNSKVSVGVDEFEVSGSSTDLGIQAGAGLTFKLSGFDTFAEAKFVNVFGDGSSSNWIPITFGVKF